MQQPSESEGRGALLAVLAMLVVVTVATNTTASLAQPQIAETFGVGPADTGWVVFGYSATFAVATALYGGIAARFGITRSLVGGVLLLAAGSAAAIVAPNMELLIVARMVQGAGSGAIPTLSTSLISRRFDGRDRARALGVVVAGVGGGQAVGPLLGGILLEFLGWRAAVSIGLVAAPAALVLARSQRGREDRPERAPRFDLIGAGLVAAVALCAAFLLNRMPLLGLVPITIVPLAVLVAAGLGLAVRTLRVERSFLPRRVLASPVFRSVVVLGAIGMSAFLGTIVVVPIAASRAYGIDGVPLGLLLLPMALVAAATSTSADRIQDRLGRAGTTRLALIALCIGPALLAVAAIPAGPFGMAAILVILGAGFGLLGAPLTNELSQSFDDQDRPVALGIYYLGFFLGAGFGAAVSSAVVQLELTLPLLEASMVPGFATAELMLALLPGIAAVAMGRGVRRRPAAKVGRPMPRSHSALADLPDPQAVIFDLDGTLVDTVETRIEAWMRVFGEEGIDANRSQVAELIGSDGRRLAREVAGELSDERAEAIDARSGEIYSKLNRSPRPLSGARQACLALDAARVAWAIATSSRRDQVGASVAALELPREPRIIDGQRVEQAKPAPDLLLHAAERLDVDPRVCWYVGDSTWDMQAARAAGMVAIGVTAGAVVSEQVLRDAGAQLVLEDLSALAERIGRR